MVDSELAAVATVQITNLFGLDWLHRVLIASLLAAVVAIAYLLNCCSRKKEDTKMTEPAIPRKPPPGSNFLYGSLGSLPNNNWVALTENGIVAQDESIDRVIELVQISSISLDSVSFAFITFDQWQ